jgi:glutathione S-transferase
VSRWFPTAEASGPAVPFALVMGGYALAVSAAELTVPATAATLPLALALGFGAARIQRGSPATLRGIGKSARAEPSQRSDRPKPPRFLLVAMPVNHYGEKLRWALDLVGAPYEEATVGGLLSAGLRGRSVPWLVDRPACSRIGNSDEALAYVGAVHVPTIDDPERRARCAALLARTDATRAWEPRLANLGHAVQGWCYHHLLAPDADREASLRAWGAREPTVALHERMVIRLGYPALRAMLQRAFRLQGPEVAAVRQSHIHAVMDAADDALAASAFLAGDHLTYVDLGFAALTAPLLAESLLFADPSPYAGGRFRSFFGATRGRAIPEPIRAMEGELAARPCGAHVQMLYRAWRTRRL